MTSPIDQPTPDLPPPIVPGGSPFWPQHLVDLLLRPTRFFSEQLALGRTPYVLLVTWALGMSSAIDRINTRIMQAEVRDDPAYWEMLETLIGTWPRLWSFVLASGVLGGALYFWIGGWWCRVRLGWSGAPSPDKDLARQLLVYSSFVFAGPAVLALVAQTLLYPSYLVAYQSEIAFSSFVLFMFFWSMVTTYKGALALFPVSAGRARLWFVILPGLFYFLLFGGTAFLLTLAP